ncbi:hypothetical protein DFQ01_13130 [Paenibacillus cellulosilyticus]|uniref:Uncharacterized protein n=1 Tax=Paenibacillus cellulosilyticus TaxID=375489 RepID=A0A2V2YLQ6_9BACL|nr:hypothetical protein [Paenibacillus cellulosilyticus]PWV94401.1 hypothetical protein DFQ01_13130 [Paenibacillus cellulosilyticus]QKS43897.1 hypothetical protein HUB94_05235 [Paenibacillus cellulosilyticus]
MSTTSSVNTACKITNNAGKPVVVLDAYDSSTNVANNSPKKGYQQSLKILSLAEGGQVLSDGGTGTVTLNDTRTDSGGKTQPNYLYQLLISEPGSLFPVMNVGEALDFDSMGYPPVTVTAAAAKNMSLAFTFCQHLMAYPTTDLAKNFQQALTDAQKEKTVDDMMKKIADYFNSTKGFKGLDFPSYLAVSTYLKAFAWKWGLDDDNKPGRTYWLYGAPGADSVSSSDSKAAVNYGSITLSRPASASETADPSDPNSGYTITYSPESGDDKQMTFSAMQLLDDASVDTPSICLQLTFARRSQFTQDTQDTALWPVLVGTLNGVKVIGVSQKPEDAFVKWLKNLVPKSFNDLVNSFLKIMGIWMAYDFLKTKFAGKKDKLQDDKTNENKGKDPSDDQQSEADQSADDIGSEALDDERSDASRLDSDEIDVPDLDNLDEVVDNVNNYVVETLREITADNYNAMIEEYEFQLKELAQIEVNPSLEEAMGKLVEAKGNLEEAIDSGDFSSVKDSLGEVKTSVTDAIGDMDISAELQEQLKESQQAIDDFQETADEMDDAANDIENGEDPIEPEVIE